MDALRLEALSRFVTTRASRRMALIGGAAAILEIGARVGRPGAAQDGGTPSASPAASPGATPGLLDVLAGTPVAGADGQLGRLPNFDCCKVACLDVRSGTVIGTFTEPVCQPHPTASNAARAYCGSLGMDEWSVMCMS